MSVGSSPVDDQTYNLLQVLTSKLEACAAYEVYADDTVLRKKTKDVLRKHMMVEEELDAEVRQRIKNLEEGTSTWDLEYKRVMDQIKQKHGLKD